MPPPPRAGPPAREYAFTLDPFQQTAVNALEAGHNVLVAAHTSGGWVGGWVVGRMLPGMFWGALCAGCSAHLGLACDGVVESVGAQ